MATGSNLKNNHKTILTDCDGVLLDWQATFQTWMVARGLEQQPGAQGYYRVQDQFDISDGEAKKYTRLFNESAAIGFLQPFRDAVTWVRRLNLDHGYRFTVITSLSEDPHAVALRKRNLLEHFGDVFDEIICLPTGSDKDQALEPWRNSGLWWCEDKPENALAGHARGLQSIILEHDHNVDFDHALITRVRNWQEIYQIVTDQLS
jgi:hypothetical protein